MATKRSTSKKRKPSASSDAIALLKEDHKKVRGLLEQLDKTTSRSSARRLDLLARIDKEITIHATIEEEIFYPAYKAAAEKSDERELYFEAAEEHGLVKTYLPRTKEVDPGSEEFGARAKVLKDLIEHHAEEEEKEMFPKARKLLDNERRKDLGMRMQERKRALQSR